MMRILADIENKQTQITPIPSLDAEIKLKEMFKDGWSAYDTTITTATEAEAEDVCIVCHENVGCGNLMHFKMQCCNARYHPLCIKTAIENGYTRNCIMCRKSTWLHESFVAFATKAATLEKESPDKAA